MGILSRRLERGYRRSAQLSILHARSCNFLPTDIHDAASNRLAPLQLAPRFPRHQLQDKMNYPPITHIQVCAKGLTG